MDRRSLRSRARRSRHVLHCIEILAAGNSKTSLTKLELQTNDGGWESRSAITTTMAGQTCSWETSEFRACITTMVMEHLQTWLRNSMSRAKAGVQVLRGAITTTT